MDLIEAKLAFLDVETTGLSRAMGDLIVEIGIVVCRGQYENNALIEVEVLRDSIRSVATVGRLNQPADSDIDHGMAHVSDGNIYIARSQAPRHLQEGWRSTASRCLVPRYTIDGNPVLLARFERHSDEFVRVRGFAVSDERCLIVLADEQDQRRTFLLGPPE